MICAVIFLVIAAAANVLTTVSAAYGQIVNCHLNPRPCGDCSRWACNHSGVGYCLSISGCSVISKSYASGISERKSTVATNRTEVNVATRLETTHSWTCYDMDQCKQHGYDHVIRFDSTNVKWYRAHWAAESESQCASEMNLCIARAGELAHFIKMKQSHHCSSRCFVNAEIALEELCQGHFNKCIYYHNKYKAVKQVLDAFIDKAKELAIDHGRDCFDCYYNNDGSTDCSLWKSNCR